MAKGSAVALVTEALLSPRLLGIDDDQPILAEHCVMARRRRKTDVKGSRQQDGYLPDVQHGFSSCTRKIGKQDVAFILPPVKATDRVVAKSFREQADVGYRFRRGEVDERQKRLVFEFPDMKALSESRDGQPAEQAPDAASRALKHVKSSRDHARQCRHHLRRQLRPRSPRQSAKRLTRNPRATRMTIFEQGDEDEPQYRWVA